MPVLISLLAPSPPPSLSILKAIDFSWFKISVISKLTFIPCDPAQLQIHISNTLLQCCFGYPVGLQNLTYSQEITLPTSPFAWLIIFPINLSSFPATHLAAIIDTLLSIAILCLVTIITLHNSNSKIHPIYLHCDDLLQVRACPADDKNGLSVSCCFDSLFTNPNPFSPQSPEEYN